MGLGRAPRRDLSGYYRHNATIHRLINEAAANPLLTTTYRSINARVQSLRFRTNQDDRKWKLAVKEHGQMIEALDARDATGLRDILIEHVHHKRDSVLKLMQSGEAYPVAFA